MYAILYLWKWCVGACEHVSTYVCVRESICWMTRVSAWNSQFISFIMLIILLTILMWPTPAEVLKWVNCPLLKQVAWPLDMVITSKCQDLYNQVFQFLLQIKRAKYGLDQLRFTGMLSYSFKMLFLEKIKNQLLLMFLMSNVTTLAKCEKKTHW